MHILNIILLAFGIKLFRKFLPNQSGIYVYDRVHPASHHLRHCLFVHKAGEGNEAELRHRNVFHLHILHHSGLYGRSEQARPGRRPRPYGLSPRRRIRLADAPGDIRKDIQDRLGYAAGNYLGFLMSQLLGLL